MQAGFTASKVSWLKRHEPDNRARTATILLPYDCINCRFHARHRSDGGE